MSGSKYHGSLSKRATTTKNNLRIYDDKVEIITQNDLLYPIPFSIHSFINYDNELFRMKTILL